MSASFSNAPRAPVTPPRPRRLHSSPTPVRPTPPRRAEVPPCAIEARRRLIRAAQENLGVMSGYDLSPECDFSPEYLAHWNDPDVEDDTYFRMRKEEEERIQHDVERALLARNRARARKAAQEAEKQSFASGSHHHGPETARPAYKARAPSSLKTTNPELERYQFPSPDSKQSPTIPSFASAAHREPPSPAPPVKAKARRGRMIPLPAHTPKTLSSRGSMSSASTTAPSLSTSSTSSASAAPPASPPKRLAPLSRFNPFMPRARSESLSSVIEEGKVGMPEHADLHRTNRGDLRDVGSANLRGGSEAETPSRRLKRANTVQEIFSKINREAYRT